LTPRGAPDRLHRRLPEPQQASLTQGSRKRRFSAATGSDNWRGLLPAYMIYLSDSGGVYDYTADEEPTVGEVIPLKPGNIRARIESVTVGEKGKMFSAVRE
jgi:hypothetical protein